MHSHIGGLSSLTAQVNTWLERCLRPLAVWNSCIRMPNGISRGTACAHLVGELSVSRPRHNGAAT